MVISVNSTASENFLDIGLGFISGISTWDSIESLLVLSEGASPLLVVVEAQLLSLLWLGFGEVVVVVFADELVLG